jgi:DNA polymerase elongation subunit (family B)
VCIFAGQSLDDLTKELDVEHKKLKELVNHKEINLENYRSLKPEIEKYLYNDCLGLLESIIKFSSEVFKATSINLSEVFTGATLSKKFFYKKFYNHRKTPIYYLSRKKDEFIRQTYFGGRNEVFKLGAINDKAYYYDFTSLYPAVAQKYLPFGEPIWVKMSSADMFKGFFGFCDVWVRTLDFTKRPLHACLKKVGQSNKLLVPHYKNWTKLRLFSKEIELGMKHKIYEYKFDDECLGIQFCAKPFLYEYFKTCFENKAKAKKEENDALAQTYKIIANSGYGFWGLRWADRESVMLGTRDDLDIYGYLKSGRLVNECNFNNSKYSSIIVQKDLEMTDFNVSVASAITSYGRQRLWELINTIESKNLKVFYCDTDSVITNCDITKHDDIMKEFCWDKTGDALGSLKNELLDKIVKYNKKNKDNPIDIKKQMEIDGGDLYFEECFVCGCKFYAVSKTIYNGEKIFMTKLKGFKDFEDSKLEFEWFRKLVSGEMTHIEHTQEQWNLPKSSMVDEERVMGLNIIPVHKTFRINYTKGIENAETHEITPFVF